MANNAQVTSVKIVDNSKEILKELGERVELALQAIGAEATTYAQKDCPVDTGALRNSIAWATSKGSGGNRMEGAGEPSEPNGQAEENAVYVGSNLEYAPAIEYKDMAHKVGKAHFLRDAVATHGEHYKAILEALLKS